MWDAVDDVLTNREPDLKFTVLCAENSPHRSLRIVLHCVAKVYAVLPFYDVKCLCSGGRE